MSHRQLKSLSTSEMKFVPPRIPFLNEYYWPCIHLYKPKSWDSSVPFNIIQLCLLLSNPPWFPPSFHHSSMHSGLISPISERDPWKKEIHFQSILWYCYLSEHFKKYISYFKTFKWFAISLKVQTPLEEFIIWPLAYLSSHIHPYTLWPDFSFLKVSSLLLPFIIITWKHIIISNRANLPSFHFCFSKISYSQLCALCMYMYS